MNISEIKTYNNSLNGDTVYEITVDQHLYLISVTPNEMKSIFFNHSLTLEEQNYLFFSMIIHKLTVELSKYFSIGFVSLYLAFYPLAKNILDADTK